mmetsp:Transcript_45770/g.110177  ORF Transcript_45770/g.110177 Transcript_45770/m.110177 type:complete len:229 (+) Transcript_45770:3326-4012(+)
MAVRRARTTRRLVIRKTTGEEITSAIELWAVHHSVSRRPAKSAQAGVNELLGRGTPLGSVAPLTNEALNSLVATIAIGTSAAAWSTSNGRRRLSRRWGSFGPRLLQITSVACNFGDEGGQSLEVGTDIVELVAISARQFLRTRSGLKRVGIQRGKVTGRNINGLDAPFERGRVIKRNSSDSGHHRDKNLGTFQILFEFGSTLEGFVEDFACLLLAGCKIRIRHVGFGR